jgi:hypothetical protein
MSEFDPEGAAPKTTPAKKTESAQILLDANKQHYCDKHQAKLVQYKGKSGGNPVVYQRCPDKKCDARAKAVPKQLEGVVSSKLTFCPHCKGVMEKHQPRSFDGRIVLWCEECGEFTEPRPDPQYHWTVMQQKKPGEYGDSTS